MHETLRVFMAWCPITGTTLSYLLPAYVAFNIAEKLQLFTRWLRRVFLSS